MFPSLNLFKSINCPFYSSANNTLACERPHCQFKHVTLNSSSAPLTSTNANNNSLKNETTQPNELNKKPVDVNINNLNQLPGMLENISNALQSVQQIISSSNLGEISESLAKLSQSNSSNQTASQISATLASLNNVLNAVTSKQDNQKQTEKSHSNTSSPVKKTSTVSASKNLKRQQSAPDYNPTPIEELKKRAEISPKPKTAGNDNDDDDDDDNDDDEENTKRRKYGSECDSANDFESDQSNQALRRNNAQKEEKPIKKLKVEEPQAQAAASSSSSSSSTTSTAKCDLVSFSKLSLSQQVLKRYEMLNKPAPTTAAIIEAKLKKHQLASGLKTTNASDQASTQQNVPHLIMDANPSSANKIPLVMRQRYLKVIFENGKSSFPTIQKACEKAAEQEKSIYDRAKNKTIYTNLAANLIKSLRTQSQHQQMNQTHSLVNSATKLTNNTAMAFKNNQNSVFKHKAHVIQQPLQPSYSHETMLSGPKANKVSYSINRVKQLEFKDLSMNQLYKIFYSYVLTEKQLEENSFPKWTDKNNKKLACIPNLSNAKKPNETKKSDQQKPTIAGLNTEIVTQTCKRCNRLFSLRAKDMLYLSNNSECVFHWGKLRNVRVDKAIEHKYSCCSGGMDSDGCEVGKHVYDGDYNGNGNGLNLTGYIQVDENATCDDFKTSLNVYALDCEMCYTTKGLELTRISIVDIHSKEVYESLVKPDTQILDYNTRWSGLTEESLRNCNKKLKHVQADLLKLFNKDTILIGHSLDSDFKAIKLIHTNVIDTSVVFPHKMGPPYKRALRNLMSEHLQKIIQEDVEGHDSKEDAASCISLMIWKINEDLRSKKFANIFNNQTESSQTNQSQNSLLTRNNSSTVNINSNNANLSSQRNLTITNNKMNVPKIASK